MDLRSTRPLRKSKAKSPKCVRSACIAFLRLISSSDPVQLEEKGKQKKQSNFGDPDLRNTDGLWSGHSVDNRHSLISQSIAMSQSFEAYGGRPMALRTGAKWSFQREASQMVALVHFAKGC